MGPESNFTIQLAFNGRGYGDFGADPYYMPNLNPETLRLRDEFLWVTHTVCTALHAPGRWEPNPTVQHGGQEG
jgi:hypothetical protein